MSCVSAQLNGDKKSMKTYDIILINPDIPIPYESSYLPYGCLFIAPHLVRAGFSIRIFDAQKEKLSVLEDLIKQSPDVLWIGFSVIRGPAIQSSLAISKMIRRCNPTVPLVWGGSFPTLIPKQTLEDDLVDIVVINEGEHSCVELSHALRKNKKLDGILGIGFKRDGVVVINPPRPFIVDWDREVELGWDFIDINQYLNSLDGKRHIDIITSRGCPFRCSFCWNISANHRQFRGWTTQRVLTELTLLERYEIEYITFIDDYFNYRDLERLTKISNYFKEKGIYWSLGNGLRAGPHLRDMLPRLKDSTCQYVTFGTESGSKRVLDYISKDISIDQILESAHLTKEYNIGARYSWMVGIPTETKQEILDTVTMIDRVRSINNKTGHYCGIFSPEPGTQLFDEAVKYSWKPPTQLREWAKWREEENSPYVSDIWSLRTICNIVFLCFKLKSPFGIVPMKALYKIPLEILAVIFRFRWRFKFFKIPIEAWLILKLKRLKERCTSS